jgi:NADPH:quinone reductase-like Zn-dependent oxidoreductase
MRAVVLHEYGGPEKLKFEDNVPDPQISGNTVLIAAAAASVNPIDWKLRSGMRRKDFPLSFPAIMGRDVSGVVRAVGTTWRTQRRSRSLRSRETNLCALRQTCKRDRLFW